MVAVPQLDSTNQHFANLEAGNMSYVGPSVSVRLVAAATAAQGSILPITPPAFNASWTSQFWGPAIQCSNVTDSNRTLILNNYGASERNQSLYTRNAEWLYLSWIARWGALYGSDDNILPFFNFFGKDNGTYEFDDTKVPNGGIPTIFLAFDAMSATAPTLDPIETPMAPIRLQRNPKQLYRGEM
jgi:hypothetical protein